METGINNVPEFPNKTHTNSPEIANHMLNIVKEKRTSI